MSDLKEYCNQFEGVNIHGKSIRIDFYFKTVRCREALKGLSLTKSNIKFASNKRAVILHEIATGTFDYAEHFPNSERALLWSAKPKREEIPTVAQAMDIWLSIKETQVAFSTIRSYKSKVENHVLPVWGHFKLNEVRQSHIKKWISVDLSSLSNKTINEVLIPFRGIFDDARADRIIDYSPLEYIDNLKIVRDEPDPFTREELAIFATTPTKRPQEVNAFIFCCWTGLRLSELLALAWEDVDLNSGTIKVQRAIVLKQYKVPKTAGSIRTVHLLEPAIEILRSQMALSAMLKPHTINVMQQDNKTVKTESLRFVFVNSLSNEELKGEAPYRDRFFKTHLKKCKIRYRGPSQARHTFASQLLTAGVNERWIANQLGHTSTKMLEQHYGKWMHNEVPDMSKRVSEQLGFSQNSPKMVPKLSK
ncbi:site-specific integrase [Pseudoalteromonas luteoviolacea]|uniref:Integrase n=1 Tax=Pseudoalteromonas luteoviolacea NCIMB 1942 TaxID=1365253 RepID=A0A167AZ70_9GAMM|nr:site-specific integrase [Pseudoalteromonas luteoviolacea]KZN45972.1 integrase [Pseudoalteromonas luteoviolacea NCIMB 1942]